MNRKWMREKVRGRKFIGRGFSFLEKALGKYHHAENTN
jgi:hypothetical protein